MKYMSIGRYSYSFFATRIGRCSPNRDDFFRHLSPTRSLLGRCDTVIVDLGSYYSANVLSSLPLCTLFLACLTTMASLQTMSVLEVV